MFDCSSAGDSFIKRPSCPAAAFSGFSGLSIPRRWRSCVGGVILRTASGPPRDNTPRGKYNNCQFLGLFSQPLALHPLRGTQLGMGWRGIQANKNRDAPRQCAPFVRWFPVGRRETRPGTKRTSLRMLSLRRSFREVRQPQSQDEKPSSSQLFRFRAHRFDRCGAKLSQLGPRVIALFPFKLPLRHLSAHGITVRLQKLDRLLQSQRDRA